MNYTTKFQPGDVAYLLDPKTAHLHEVVVVYVEITHSEDRTPWVKYYTREAEFSQEVFETENRLFTSPHEMQTVLTQQLKARKQNKTMKPHLNAMFYAELYDAAYSPGRTKPGHLPLPHEEAFRRVWEDPEGQAYLRAVVAKTAKPNRDILNSETLCFAPIAGCDDRQVSHECYELFWKLSGELPLTEPFSLTQDVWRMWRDSYGSVGKALYELCFNFRQFAVLWQHDTTRFRLRTIAEKFLAETHNTKVAVRPEAPYLFDGLGLASHNELWQVRLDFLTWAEANPAVSTLEVVP